MDPRSLDLEFEVELSPDQIFEALSQIGQYEYLLAVQRLQIAHLRGKLTEANRKKEKSDERIG